MCILVPFYLRNNQNLKRIICYGLFDDYTVLGVVTSVVVNHQSSQTNVLLLFSFLLTRIIIIICPYFPVL